MLQRVKYVNPHFFFLKKKIRLLKWYLTYSNWLNSHTIYKNSKLPLDTDIYKSNLGPLWCHLRYIFNYTL